MTPTDQTKAKSANEKSFDAGLLAFLRQNANRKTP